MKEYQFYAIAQDGTLNHAGVHKLGRFSNRTIVKLERKWQTWRKQYIDSHPGDYPLKHDCKKLTTNVVVFPVGMVNQQKVFKIGVC